MIRLSQNIKQIAEQQLATANTATNATHVYQVLVELAKQTCINTRTSDNLEI